MGVASVAPVHRQQRRQWPFTIKLLVYRSGHAGLRGAWLGRVGVPLRRKFVDKLEV